MSNGCGPQWFERFALTRWFREYLFDWFFEASCNKHDEGYAQGGDEIRRFECDWKFYQVHEARHTQTERHQAINMLGNGFLLLFAGACFWVASKAGGLSL